MNKTRRNKARRRKRMKRLLVELYEELARETQRLMGDPQAANAMRVYIASCENILPIVVSDRSEPFNVIR